MAAFGGVGANNTKAAIDDAFVSYITEEKFRKCLVSACADGASVNMGRLNGALNQLKKEGRPWLLIIHCSAHRIELAVKDAFKEAAEFTLIDDMMLNLHIFFRNSGKCWRLLVLLAERLGVLLQRIPKSSGTRFQIHKYRAIKTLIVNYLPLCLFAENLIESNNKMCKPEQKAKLRGYLNQWLSYQYLASLQLYRLTLKQTAHLSYCTQNAGGDFLISDIINIMKSVEEELHVICDTDQDLPFPVELSDDGDSATITVEATNLPANQRFKDMNQLTDKQKEHAQKCVTVVKESYELKKVKSGKANAERIKSKLIPAISHHIEQRMKSFEEDIFTSFRIADYTQWDPSDKDYGNAEIHQIYQHFKECLEHNKFSINMALAEWRALKKLVTSKFSHFSNKVDMWQRVFTHHQIEYPHILQIIELILIIPFSSASVERGFSAMGRLLSNTRSSMSNKVLDNLMVIKLNLPILCKCDGHYEEKLIIKAVEMYLGAKKRRDMTPAQHSDSSICTPMDKKSDSDTYLPISAETLITTSNELSCAEDFLVQCELSDESDNGCNDSVSSVSDSSDRESDAE